MNNDTKSIVGVTSLAYHITMWILVIAGLLGNLLVLVWRCLRKESRHSLLSMLIISLAIADLLFSCHFLLEEVMLANPVFVSHQENLTIHISTRDERLCFSVLFLAGVSANAIILTAVAIALATSFCFRLHRYGHRIIILFLVVSWMYCLAFGGLLIWKFRSNYENKATSPLDVNVFSFFVVYGCIGSFPYDYWNPFPIIITTLNAIGSVVVTVIYIYLWCIIRKHGASFTHSCNQEMTLLRIRLTIISGLNLLCWWPASFLFWFVSAEKRSVSNGSLSPVATEPTLVISAAVSAANPIIYTIASKRFLTAIRRTCVCLLCRCRRVELLPILMPNFQDTTHGEVEASNWASFCCPCQQPSPVAEVLVCHPESVTENTEEASLFSESE